MLFFLNGRSEQPILLVKPHEIGFIAHINTGTSSHDRGSAIMHASSDCIEQSVQCSGSARRDAWFIYTTTTTRTRTWMMLRTDGRRAFTCRSCSWCRSSSWRRTCRRRRAPQRSPPPQRSACMHQIICIRIQNNSSFRYNQSHQVVSRFAIISHNRLVN